MPAAEDVADHEQQERVAADRPPQLRLGLRSGGAHGYRRGVTILTSTCRARRAATSTTPPRRRTTRPPRACARTPCGYTAAAPRMRVTPWRGR